MCVNRRGVGADMYDPAHVFFPADPLGKAVYHQLAFYLSGTVDNLTATSSPVQRAVEAAAAAQPSPGSAGAPAFKASMGVNRLAWDTTCAPVFEQQLTSRYVQYLASELVWLSQSTIN
jgi:hypothetical protein